MTKQTKPTLLFYRYIIKVLEEKAHSQEISTSCITNKFNEWSKDYKTTNKATLYTLNTLESWGLVQKFKEKHSRSYTWSLADDLNAFLNLSQAELIFFYISRSLLSGYRISYITDKHPDIEKSVDLATSFIKREYKNSKLNILIKNLSLILETNQPTLIFPSNSESIQKEIENAEASALIEIALATPNNKIKTLPPDYIFYRTSAAYYNKGVSKLIRFFINLEEKYREKKYPIKNSREKITDIFLNKEEIKNLLKITSEILSPIHAIYQRLNLKQTEKKLQIKTLPGLFRYGNLSPSYIEKELNNLVNSHPIFSIFEKNEYSALDNRHQVTADSMLYSMLEMPIIYHDDVIQTFDELQLWFIELAYRAFFRYPASPRENIQYASLFLRDSVYRYGIMGMHSYYLEKSSEEIAKRSIVKNNKHLAFEIRKIEENSYADRSLKDSLYEIFLIEFLSKSQISKKENILTTIEREHEIPKIRSRTYLDILDTLDVLKTKEDMSIFKLKVSKKFPDKLSVVIGASLERLSPIKSYGYFDDFYSELISKKLNFEKTDKNEESIYRSERFIKFFSNKVLGLPKAFIINNHLDHYKEIRNAPLALIKEKISRTSATKNIDLDFIQKIKVPSYIKSPSLKNNQVTVSNLKNFITYALLSEQDFLELKSKKKLTVDLKVNLSPVEIESHLQNGWSSWIESSCWFPNNIDPLYAEFIDGRPLYAAPISEEDYVYLSFLLQQNFYGNDKE